LTEDASRSGSLGTSDDAVILDTGGVHTRPDITLCDYAGGAAPDDASSTCLALTEYANTAKSGRKPDDSTAALRSSIATEDPGPLACLCSAQDSIVRLACAGKANCHH